MALVKSSNTRRLKVLMPDLMKIEYNTRVLQEANSLIKNGFDVNILGFSNKSREFKREVEGVQCYSYFLSDKRDGVMKIARYVTAIRMFVATYLFILKGRFDVYHAHNFHVLPASVISAKMKRKKVFYDAHETWTVHRREKYHLEHVFAYILEKLFLRYITGFVTVNEMVRDHYKSKYGLKGGVVLYNTRDVKPLKRQKLFHEELNIGRDKKIVLFQGGLWGHNRGLFELIEASRHITDEAVVVFVGFGSTSVVEEMRKRIRNAKLDTKTFIMPAKKPSELLDYTMSADVGMNLINREGKAQDFQSPWKLFEYCMAGLAVISTDLPFHRKVHEEYGIGPLIGINNDPKDIVGAVNALFGDPARLSQCRKNARQAAESEYNWGNQEQKLLDLYRGLK